MKKILFALLTLCFAGCGYNIIQASEGADKAPEVNI